MKMTIINRGNLIITASIVLSLTFSIPLSASERVVEKTEIEFKFIGSVNNQPLFQLNLHNAEEDEYIVTISDKYGNLLYSDRMKGINITKRFRFVTDEIGDEALKVKVRSRKTNKLDIYEIKSSSRLVEEAYVTKL